MGEKKLRDFLTLKDIATHYGFSYSSITKKTKDLEPALIKLSGKALKPYRYDADKVAEIIGTAQAPSRRQNARPTESLKRRSSKKAESDFSEDELDDLFDE